MAGEVKENRVAHLENLRMAEGLQERFKNGLSAAKAELRRLETEREIIEEKIKKQRAVVQACLEQFRRELKECSWWLATMASACA